MSLQLKGDVCVVWFEEDRAATEQPLTNYPVFLDGMDDQDGNITELIDAGYRPVSHSVHPNPSTGGTSWSILFFRDPEVRG